jgi:hypothetical protein
LWRIMKMNFEYLTVVDNTSWSASEKSNFDSSCLLAFFPVLLFTHNNWHNFVFKFQCVTRSAIKRYRL